MLPGCLPASFKGGGMTSGASGYSGDVFREAFLKYLAHRSDCLEKDGGEMSSSPVAHLLLLVFVAVPGLEIVEVDQQDSAT